MSKKYSISDYDKHVSLKLSLGVWVVLIYFLRPFILVVSSFQMGKGVRNDNVSVLKNMVYPDDFSLFIGVLAALPTLLIIFAYIKRAPGASDFIKRLWCNGAKLLTVVAILNVLILFLPATRDTAFYITATMWVQLIIAVVIIVFLNTSQRVKDTFADFP